MSVRCTNAISAYFPPFFGSYQVAKLDPPLGGVFRGGKLEEEGERVAQVVEIGDLARDNIAEAVTGPAISLLDTCPQDLWPRLSKLQLTALDRAAKVAHLPCSVLLPCCLEVRAVERGRGGGRNRRDSVVVGALSLVAMCSAVFNSGVTQSCPVL